MNDRTDHAIEQAALRYLARRDRTEAQVRAFLSRAGATAGRIRSVIAQFHRQGYLNDEAYAQRWARVRVARRPMGRDRLEAELLAQGLDRTIVTATVERVYRERPERDLARELLKRRPGVRSQQTHAGQAILLRRHGFGEELIEDLLGGSSSA